MVCGESMTGCQEIVAVWTLGINGQCFPDEFGMLLGDGGFTALWMEVGDNRVEMTSNAIKLIAMRAISTANGATKVNEAIVL